MGQPLRLDTDVQFVKGVGPVRARALEQLGVRTVGDLIHHFPFRHQLRPKSIAIGKISRPGETVTLVGQLRSVRSRGPAHKLRVSADLVDGTGLCRLRWFNTAWLADRLHNGLIVRVTGKVDVPNRYAALANPQIVIVERGEDPFSGDEDRFDPVYPANANISSKEIARAVQLVLDEAVALVADHVPPPLYTRRKLPDRRAAIRLIHLPDDPEQAAAGRRRLAYDEFLLMQLAVRIRRRIMIEDVRAPIITTTAKIDERIRARIPFALTAGQNEAVAGIAADLARRQPMNRLLQADVGAGKTAVALYAALTTIANKHQVALLAPTEVLASQHHEKVERYLKGSRVRIALLTGSTPAAARRQIYTAIRRGEIDLLIGTHALIEEAVGFARLGLVIIDEQHRFGVAQRARLRSKGEAPHCLVLTATPIPRTLAMTVFGDVDVSVIAGLPPGRKPVKTHLVGEKNRGGAWADVRKRLDAGQQAFVVYPLVDDSETLDLRSATQQAEELKTKQLAGHDVGLLHGRMSAADKHQVMSRFREGRLPVLVATTVVEVGVDVPGATMMVIEHAERYGLSQLHQLRGRVGRGDLPGVCYLMTDTDNEAALERLKVVCTTSDGFRIAEEDLRLRGPGELLGKRQHGMPALKVASLVEDLDLLTAARDDADAILRVDPTLTRAEHRGLHDALKRDYAESMGMIDVA